ncbi:MAG: AarF/ABC1/UbiB kinase family protein [Thiolinea sp.]
MDDSERFSDDEQARIPSSRLARLSRLGVLAGGVAGGMLAEGARQLAAGKRPKANELLLTPANVRRVTEQLAQLRGAAMKVGQLLSMDAGEMLPAELSAILARLRSEAKPMPLSQLAAILEENWGKGWEQRFRQFSFKPLAAASIGQVHDAHTRDGRHLALKIQYPGIRASIDSDVDNVATLLRVSGLLPKHLDMRPLLEEAKQQLQAEADYRQEAAWMQRYAELLAGAEDFSLPAVHEDFSTTAILAMDFMHGVPVESLAGAAQPERDRVVSLLLALLFREIFEFRLVQTDPNFANYQYDSAQQRLILFDFGATRAYPQSIVDGYRQLMLGALQDDRAQMDAGAAAIGFEEYIRPEQRRRYWMCFSRAANPCAMRGLMILAAASWRRGFGMPVCG